MPYEGSKVMSEEPDVLIGHVRICGGPGGQPATPIINELRHQVDLWRDLKNPNDWRVEPETARLLQHWRHHPFTGMRPFFCQIEAIETLIWLTEVVPKVGKVGNRFLDHLANANNDANPELTRLALKLATGTGKTTVMAMLIIWQTVNAVRRPNSKRFTRGFLVVTPGITIRDRLRVLQPNDPDSYYQSRELIPNDMLPDLERAKIVITNYHAFMLRERMELSKGGRSLLQGRGEPLKTLETEGQMLFKGKVDCIVATESNRDVNYFSNVVEAAARDLHCYVIQVNDSRFGDSRIVSPSKTEKMNPLRIKGGENLTFLTMSLDLKALRDHQRKGYGLQKDSEDFKPTPRDSI